MSTITIATTIAPKNIENQQKAIQSWLKLGFSVVSLNTATEVKQLQSHFPEIIFHTVGRDATTEAGRPLIYTSDIFSYLKQSPTDICGIINSDIHLKGHFGIVDFLEQEAKDSLVFTSRVEVSSLEQTAGEFNWKGMDTFFFDKNILTLLPDSHFCLGMPWWDVWLIITVLAKGKSLKYLITPFAYHISHPWNWDMGKYMTYGIHFVEFFGKSPEVAKQLIALTRQDQNEVNQQLRQINAQNYNFIYLSKKTKWIVYDMFSAQL